MKVTVITTVFNLIKNGREVCFRQMLDSVHKQTYADIEHVVVDGGSLDGTVKLLQEYADKKWIRFISEKDNGIYEGMNKGANLATGDVLTFLNSDDYFHNPKAVELSVKAIQNADFTYAPTRTVDEEKGLAKTGKIKIYRLLRNMPFPHAGMFVRKDVFNALNQYDTHLKLEADYDFILRLYLNHYRGKEVKETLATFRKGGATDLHKDLHDSERAYIYEKNYSNFLKVPTDQWQEMPKSYCFPFKLLKNIYLNSHSVPLQKSCSWIFFNTLKRKLLGKK